MGTRYTTSVALTSAWQQISVDGSPTCLVEVSDVARGRVGVAVADAIGDLDAETRPQHILTPIDRPVANFFGLGSKRVFARKTIVAESPSVTVTNY